MLYTLINPTVEDVRLECMTDIDKIHWLKSNLKQINDHFMAHTLEGCAIVYLGDWIVKDLDGKVKVFKDCEFTKRYKKVR